jgi:hypothetical protein
MAVEVTFVCPMVSEEALEVPILIVPPTPLVVPAPASIETFPPTPLVDDSLPARSERFPPVPEATALLAG